MFDLFVSAGLVLTAQPTVSENAIISCQAQAVFTKSGVEGVLCGLEVIDGQLVYGAETGERADLGPVPRGPRLPGDLQETLWVMSHADSFIVGVTIDSVSRAAMIHWSSERNAWRREDVVYGECGWEHVFGFTQDGRYAATGYASDGAYQFCRLDFETMTHSRDWVEPRAELLDFEQMQFGWWTNGEFVVRTPASDEIFRNFLSLGAACGSFVEAYRRPYSGERNGLCGVDYENGGLYLSHHRVGAAPGQPPADDTPGGAEFWVMRENNSAIFGVSRSGLDTMIAIGGPDGAYSTAPFPCGANGPEHVFGFFENARYAIAIAPAGADHKAQAPTSAHLVCVFDHQTMSQTDTRIEYDLEGWAYRDLELVWMQGEGFAIHRPEGRSANVERSTGPARTGDETMRTAADRPQDPCSAYEASIAPIDSGSVLCGVSVNDGEVTVHYPDGRTFPVTGAVRLPQRFSENDVTQFWVMQAGHSTILGLRGPIGQHLYMIAREESGGTGWHASPVRCGEYGPDHVFTYAGGGEHAFAAYSLEGHITFCALGIWRHDQEHFRFENGADLGIPLDRLRIESWSCGDDAFKQSNICFAVYDPAGNEVFRREEG